MLKETIGFVVFIFIIDRISMGGRGGVRPPWLRLWREQVDATQTYYKRWSPPDNICDFLEKK